VLDADDLAKGWRGRHAWIVNRVITSMAPST
jgi:hypothetical protein